MSKTSNVTTNTTVFVPSLSIKGIESGHRNQLFSPSAYIAGVAKNPAEVTHVVETLKTVAYLQSLTDGKKRKYATAVLNSLNELADKKGRDAGKFVSECCDLLGRDITGKDGRAFFGVLVSLVKK